jgi:hypothetical protein
MDGSLRFWFLKIARFNEQSWGRDCTNPRGGGKAAGELPTISVSSRFTKEAHGYVAPIQVLHYLKAIHSEFI